MAWGTGVVQNTASGKLDSTTEGARANSVGAAKKGGVRSALQHTPMLRPEETSSPQGAMPGDRGNEDPSSFVLSAVPHPTVVC